MSKIKLLKGLASLFQKKKPKKTEKFGPPRDPERDYETAAALKESRKLYDLERKNLSPLQDELNKMLKAEQTKLDDSLNQLKVATFEMEEMGKALDEFNRIADEDGIEAALEAFEGILNPKRTLNADGGRIELGIGGAASGIMQAIKLAAKGIKPFGQKQTYKQKVKMVGLQELQKGMKKEFDMELYKINKGRAGNPEAELFDLYEDVMSGKRYSMLPDKTRQEMMDQIEDSMRNYNVDGGDFQNFMGYMADEYGVSRDVQNNPFKF